MGADVGLIAEITALRAATEKLAAMASGTGDFVPANIRTLRVFWSGEMSFAAYQQAGRLIGDWFRARGAGLACIDGPTDWGSAWSVECWWKGESEANVDPLLDLVKHMREGEWAQDGNGNWKQVWPSFVGEPIAVDWTDPRQASHWDSTPDGKVVWLGCEGVTNVTAR
jgi:hypothetical protein